MNVELVLDARAALGEGAIWDARQQRLLWVDIHSGTLHQFHPADGSDRALPIGQMLGTVVPRARGGVMLALHHGLAAYDLEHQDLHTWCDPEAHLPRNRFNDGKCDPAGRFWAGTMSIDREQGAGSLYCLDPDGRLRTMLRHVTCSNGIVWSQDARTMYYIDTPLQEVSAFAYDLATGQIDQRRTAFAIPPQRGKPDGMTLDAQGMLWIAMWDGGRVDRWDPHSGRHLAEIRLPALRVTSCAFGGPNLDELFITTARTGLSAAQLTAQPHAGSLFRARPGVCGLPALEFAG